MEVESAILVSIILFDEGFSFLSGDAQMEIFHEGDKVL
jgi:hypothetical protein